jgi:hypothetical protein
MTTLVVNKLCPICELEISPTEDKFMVGVEVPYLNFYVHRSCWIKIKDDLKRVLEEILKNPKKREILYKK